MDGVDHSGLLSAYSPHHPHHHGGGGVTSSSSAHNAMFSSGASAAYASPPAEPVRRKRGRPRKYGPPPPSRSASQPKTMTVPSSSPTSPSAFVRAKEGSSASPSSSRKPKLASLGNAGHGFKTHVITVMAGELSNTKFSFGKDVAQKIMSFVQQFEHTFCVLAASGSISKASLLHPAVFGGSVTYEGKFEILSLSGSFVHNRADGDLRTGGLSICLSGADGRVVGGGVKGPLVAAEPVQVIAGSFLIDGDGCSIDSRAAVPTGKLPTSLNAGLTFSTATLGLSTEFTGRYGSEINHVIQSPADWSGRQEDRHSGASHFLDED
ncbi:AT-hook motif nuclear-localized protein 10-like isoform X1 [Zingiber officinale]|uniref:AT-hook motif nuclear-localized protein 10-like isoform X1 n=1 Tax=Zingiber officinale TaxID=94328 RepID=UPI001C4C62EE|nr:AT-hook motif nuclear-localized protein 10-like isoform X1 [Zingiber officinale]